jgi:high affinity sulfate transporter 1
MAAATEVTGATRRTRLERWVPGLRTARTYERAWFSRDLMAGVVLMTLLVPQGMAYAELAGLPAITGLYATVVCLVAYALMGPSPILVLGPDSALGPMIAATILPLAAGDQQTAVALAGVLALMVGLITLGAGLARLGFIGDLLSSPVRTGYLTGLAIVILVDQLPKLFGFGVEADGLVAGLVAFLRGLADGLTDPWSLGIGLISLAIILGLRRLSPRTPGILVAVVLSIGLSVVLDLAGRGVAVIGVLPQGFPTPALPHVDPADLPLLLASAVGISLVAIGDTISTSGGFAAKAGYRLDGDQELAGIGTANVATGLFSGFPVTTSSSRTAVALQSGARTQLTGLVAAALVLTMLIAAPGLVQAMPQPVLAAIVIAASISLFDAAGLRWLWHMRRSEFLLALTCVLGVAFLGVLQGIIVAVVLSVAWVFQRAWTPHSAILGKPAGVPGWHDVERYADTRQVPGLLIVRWSAPLFFANATRFRDRITGLVDSAEAPLRWVLVAAEPITDIDTTAARVLTDLDIELNERGIHLAFAELQSEVRDRIIRFGVLETLDQGHLYPSVTEAVAAFRREVGETSTSEQSKHGSADDGSKQGSDG